jgi:hypothetical protein
MPPPLTWPWYLLLLVLKATWRMLRGLYRLVRVVLRYVVWRWRRFMAPLWVALLVAVLGTVGHRHWPAWWWPPLVLMPVALLLVAPLPRLRTRYRVVLERVAPDWDRTLLDRPLERAYAGTALGSASGWVALRTGTGASPLADLLWIGATAALATAWWWHRRVRTGGRAGRYRRRIEKLARGGTKVPELRVFEHCKVVRVQRGRRGSARLRVRLQGGLTAASANAAAAALDSYLNLRAGAVRVQEDPSRARCVWLQVVPRDPWAGDIPHPCPDVLSTTLSTVGGTFPMGVLADGTPDHYKLQHTWLVGQTGAGKSKWVESCLRWLVAFTDVVLVGVDMAGGATLAPWRKVLALPLADDPDKARFVLERALAVVEDRERRLGLTKEGGGDGDDFDGDDSTPWLVLIIDEFAELVAQGPVFVELVNSLAKRGRKARLALLLCSQNATRRDGGLKEIQAQAGATIGLRLSEHANRVLWGALGKLGWDSRRLKPGEYLLRDADHSSPVVGKGYLIRGSDRRTAVAAAAGRTPALEPSAWAALTGTAPPAVDLGTPTDDPILALLDELGPRRVDDLVPLLPYSRATAFRRLKKLEKAGEVTADGGVWART